VWVRNNMIIRDQIIAQAVKALHRGANRESVRRLIELSSIAVSAGLDAEKVRDGAIKELNLLTII